MVRENLFSLQYLIYMYVVANHLATKLYDGAATEHVPSYCVYRYCVYRYCAIYLV